MVIRWLIHLKDGRTILDDQGPEVDQVNPDQISSLELLSPHGNKVIVKSCSAFKDFHTLVTASEYLNYSSGQQAHTEDERILGFTVDNTVITVTIDCKTNNIKISGKKVVNNV
jgi:hypothetical protein